MTNGIITDLNVRLNSFSHTHPDDVDILLAANHLPGLNAIVLSDIGGSNHAVNLNLVLDDQASAPLPDATQLVSGTFQPTNIGAGDAFAAPAPVPSGNSLLSVFNGQNPNGTWQLFISDDQDIDTGNLAGWSLEVTAVVDV